MKITEIKGRAIPIYGNDIDTDRIIPARFLKEITFSNMGNYLFYDERFDEKGNKKGHIIDNQIFRGARILVVNKNFGCGSSREHAVHAIKKCGIDIVVGESFSTLFHSNCLALGIPIVEVSSEIAKDIAQFIEKEPQTEIKVSITEKRICYGKKIEEFKISEHAWKALTNGTWNSTRMLLENMNLVNTLAANLPYIQGFL